MNLVWLRHPQAARRTAQEAPVNPRAAYALRLAASQTACGVRLGTALCTHQPMNDLIARLLAHERIRAARRHVERADELTLARQAALSATPAPTGAEAARGARVAELFREIGLAHVGVDQAGNVRGWFGNGDGSAPVVLAAHLDTVFGPEVDVRVTRHGHRLEGPGISDNARGLAALLAVAEALVATRVPTARPILFAATVGEEGSGDLRGVKYLLNGGMGDGGRGHPLPAAFIALDGAGLERV